MVATPPAFHIMAKPHGPICNLDCHCYYYLAKEPLYPGGITLFNGGQAKAPIYRNILEEIILIDYG